MNRPMSLAPIGLLVMLVTAVASLAPAAIVVDEFDDPDSVALPQMNLDYIGAADVGELSAQRNLRFVAFHTDPTGQYESAPNGESSLYGRLDDLNPRFDGDRDVHLQFWYDFDSVDATQGGVNDAFLLDFTSLSSPKTTASLRVFVGDDVSSRYNVTLPLPASDHPFTFVVPFAGLDWGPSTIEPDFSKLRSVHFTLSVLPPVGQNELDFSMTLDRVRIGQVIPEPGGVWIAASALLGLLACRRGSWQGNAA